MALAGQQGIIVEGDMPHALFIGGPLDGRVLDVTGKGDRIVAVGPLGPGGYGQVIYERRPDGDYALAEPPPMSTQVGPGQVLCDDIPAQYADIPRYRGTPST
jgi:hypothetical protein